MTVTQPRTRLRLGPLAWIVSSVGALVFVIGIIAWLGGMHDPHGNPWIDNPDAIIIALIGAVGIAIPPLVTNLRQIRRGVESTRDHVVNSHTDRNLRDDIDTILRKIDSLTGRVSDISELQRDQGKDIRGLREEVGQIRQIERDQWAAIETTAARRRTKGTS